MEIAMSETQSRYFVADLQMQLARCIDVMQTTEWISLNPL